ncbi:MAG TPA: hypothetical protein VGI74_12035, partial [Streptosporangiaceae bacterium]
MHGFQAAALAGTYIGLLPYVSHSFIGQWLNREKWTLEDFTVGADLDVALSVDTTERERQLSGDLEGEYFFNRSKLKDIPRRLVALEEGYDPGTVSRLENLGVGRGWSCLEVGAGAGSITRWLGRRVGAEGEIVAIDLDTSFLDVFDADNV